MLKNLIIVEKGKDYQFDTLEDIVKALIDEDYYNLAEEERTEKMKMKALANCINNKMNVVEEIQANDMDNKFIIKDEITYILSLLVTNNLILLEKKDSNILTKDLNKEDIEENYIVVNTFAKGLLEKYIN